MVIEDGGESTIKVVLVTLPPVLLYAVFVSVIIKDHDVPDNPENVVGLEPLVEKPEPELLIVYEYTIFKPTPPDQEAMNPDNEMDEAEIPEIAVGGAKTVNDAGALEYPLVDVIVKGHEVN